ncbi:MAG: UDP-2 3-diacylglucosamine hydrolase [Halothiobacillaceae bacterium]|nr:MAG: UDP-2 3-diacylglucosamine hydrolase [Halothiobacillaceae bacterium]
MTTLFISDLHLSAKQPAIALLLETLLARSAGKVEAIYILGDLFDAWIGDDCSPEFYPSTIAALQKTTTQGTPISLLHGNRDFLLGELFAQQCGITLLADPVVIDLYGQATLLSHGDALCTDDIEYQQFRAQVRHPATQKQFLALPPAERLKVASHYRSESQKRGAEKSQEIMDVNQTAVEAVMRQHHVHHLIHGHTHRPNLHHFELDGSPATRTVLGDWSDTHASVLISNRESSTLRRLTLTDISTPSRIWEIT